MNVLARGIRVRLMSVWLGVGCAGLMMGGLGTSAVLAQSATATLSGTVVDVDGAIIPHAKVVVVNRTTKFKRTLEANGSGVFSFPGLDSGDYDLTITYKGFSSLQVSKLHLDPGSSLNLDTLKLKVGEVTQVINVTADDLNHVEDTGEKSSIITSKDLQQLTLVGRDVTELLKILPGSAIGPGGNNGANNGSGPGNAPFDGGNLQIGGAAGSYSMSGSPTNGVSISSDGANLTDPGSYSGGLQTINQENTEEVKVSQANFGADTANGPLVINAVGKVGGQVYHGELYMYARSGVLNTVDGFARELNEGKPGDRYLYPGGQIGGPLKIPGTDFNHNKRITFFVSGEDYVQKNTYAYGNVSSAIWTALVPTPALLAGDFSAAALANYLPAGTRICTAAEANQCGTIFQNISGFQVGNIAEVPVSSYKGDILSCNGVPGDCIAPYLDKGAKDIFSTLAPLPNTAGGTVGTGLGGGYNFEHVNLVDNNFWQTYAKVEDAITDNQKVNLVYSAQMGNTLVPQGQYFASGSSGSLLMPGGGSNQNTHTQTGSANWTSIWSATLTNEAYLGLAYNDHFLAPKNAAATFSSLNGYPYTGAYANGSKEFPTLQDYGYNGLPLDIFPDYSYGPQYVKTLVPTVGDNLTKTIRTHTVKVGVDFERPQVNDFQSNGANPTQGSFAGNYYTTPTFYLPGAPTGGYHSSCYSPTNPYCYPANQLANFMMGIFDSYSQANEIAHIDMYNWTNSFYGQDDWKLRKNLSVTLGVRFEHLGRWTDKHGIGPAVWNAALYNTDPLNNAQYPLPGFRWHGNDSAIPIGGFATRALFYAPRVGFNWDPYKTGKTTVSGGWGMFRFHEGEGDAEQYLQVPAGVRNTNVSNPNNQAGLTMNYVDSLNLSPNPNMASSTFSNANTGYYTTTSGVIGLDPTDNQSPLTTNYSLTVSQQMRGSLLFTIGYVGNKSTHLLNDGSNEGVPVNDNINALPIGALFTPDPNPQSNYYGLTYTAAGLGSLGTGDGIPLTDDWRPYKHYGELQVTRHALYANYNSLQATLEKSKGIATFHMNYTFSKNLGVRGSYFNGTAADSFNPHNNYGPLSYDRSQIFNISYFLNFGTWYHGFKPLGVVVNGWQASGYTGIQSGPNMQSNNYITNFGISGTVLPVGNQASYPINSLTYLGTPDVQLQPTVTCNPTAGLKKKQYMTSSCFGLPAQGGANGSYNFPYIHGPAYYSSDFTLIRTVKLPESRSLEFRGAAFNILNSKLNTFTGKGPGQTQLTFPLANPSFGQTTYTVGRRVIELMVKLKF